MLQFGASTAQYAMRLQHTHTHKQNEKPKRNENEEEEKATKIKSAAAAQRSTYNGAYETYHFFIFFLNASLSTSIYANFLPSNELKTFIYYYAKNLP